MAARQQGSSHADLADNGLLYKAPSIVGTPRYDQGANNIGDDESRIETMSAAPTTRASRAGDGDNGSLYSYHSTTDMNRFVQNQFGRIFNTLNTNYILPTDEVEWNRLDKQHAGFLIANGGLYPNPEVIEPLLQPGGGDKAILDIGCGTGTWAIEMGKRFPHVTVTGVDIAPTPLDPDTFPPNVAFEVDDINRGLDHFKDSFDLVHMKLVRSGINDLQKTMGDLEACLKPGGVLLIVDADPEFQDQDFIKIKMAKVNGDEDVSGVSTEGSWFTRFHWEMVEAGNVKGIDHERSLELIDAGLWDHPLIDPATAVSGSVYMPIGPWAKCSDPVQSQLLKYVGVIMRQVCTNLHRTFHSGLRQFGMNEEELDEWSRHTQKELDTMNPRYSVRFPFCWARRRAGPGLPAPPLPQLASPLDEVTRFPYPFFETFHSAEEAKAARRKRRDSLGVMPSAAVKRAQAAAQS